MANDYADVKKVQSTVDMLMKNQNPFDLATVPPELTDMISQDA